MRHCPSPSVYPIRPPIYLIANINTFDHIKSKYIFFTEQNFSSFMETGDPLLFRAVRYVHLKNNHNNKKLKANKEIIHNYTDSMMRHLNS